MKMIRALTSVLLIAASGAGANASPLHSTRYACDPRQHFVVESNGRGAIVHFVDRTYELKRKASDLGIKYVSPSATLIIDGPSAIFVADDRLQLGACTETMPVAEAR